MELNAFCRRIPMSQAHHDAVFRLCADFKTGRDFRNHQRVIPRGGESLWQVFEQSLRVVKNLTDLPVHESWRANDLPAEHFANRLVSQANAEYWRRFVEVTNNILRNSSVDGRTRPWRNHDA